MHHSVKAKANSDRPTILHIAPVNLISQSPATTPSQFLTRANCFISSKPSLEPLLRSLPYQIKELKKNK